MDTLPPVTVWMVRLARGEADRDVRGTLSIEEDALLFTTQDQTATARLTFAEIHRAKRLRGSPVLMIESGSAEDRQRTAFFFSQPPPLHPASGRTPLDGGVPPTSTPFGLIRRSGKRRAQRTNAQYLQTSGIGKKDLIQEWASQVSSRIARG